MTTLEAKLSARVDTSAGLFACWPWTGWHDEKGYGRVNIGSRTTHAHRLAFELAGGTIPTGHVVRHTCDNPPCCNPAHLRTGTVADNQRDMVARGRSTKGRYCGGGPRRPARPRGSPYPDTTDRDPERAATVLRMLDAGYKHRDIKAALHIGGSAIARIVRVSRSAHRSNGLDGGALGGVASAEIDGLTEALGQAPYVVAGFPPGGHRPSLIPG
jgi:hypothetical protein